MSLTLIKNKTHTDANTKRTATDSASETVMVVRSGTKKYGLLRFE